SAAVFSLAARNAALLMGRVAQNVGSAKSSDQKSGLANPLPTTAASTNGDKTSQAAVRAVVSASRPAKPVTAASVRNTVRSTPPERTKVLGRHAAQKSA